MGTSKIGAQRIGWIRSDFSKDIACLWLEFHEFEALTETNKSLNSVIRLFGIKMSVVTIT